MRKHILYTAVPTIIFAIILVLITWDNINTGITSVIGFDEAYNAQVAKHFAETGKYAVTYPDEIVFYNSITTGPTMLLGTAFLYKVWGISNFTTNFIPITFKKARVKRYGFQLQFFHLCILPAVFTVLFYGG